MLTIRELKIIGITTVSVGVIALGYPFGLMLKQYDTEYEHRLKKLEISETNRINDITERKRLEHQHTQRELQALTTAIYFEARGEPAKGQYAVAQNIVNRVEGKCYPNTIQEVVYQHNGVDAQYSFVCPVRGKCIKFNEVPRVTDENAYRTAKQVATAVYTNKPSVDYSMGNEHYHNPWKAGWGRYAKYRYNEVMIGNHLFYSLDDGRACNES